MPEIVDTHLSFFKAEIEFVEPNLKIWLDRIAMFPRIAGEFLTILNMTRKFAEGLARLHPRLPVNRGVRRQ
jgi:hypothetical protein